MPLTISESTELAEKADAVGNSYAAGEGAAKVSDAIEDLKSFARSLAVEDAPAESEPISEPQPSTEPQSATEPQETHELEPAQ